MSEDELLEAYGPEFFALLKKGEAGLGDYEAFLEETENDCAD